MPSLPPLVVGPLSECNEVVEVQAQVTGSTVRVYSDGQLVGQGVATSANQAFPLSPGKHLHAGAKVTATQDQGDGESPHSPQPVVVQKKPATVGPVTFYNPIYACGECLAITGAVPGATVKIAAKVGTQVSDRGSAVAPNGYAGVFLTQPTGPGEVLIAHQVACGTAGPRTQAMALTTDKLLPTPALSAALVECSESVIVSNVVPGAVVTVHRASGDRNGCYVDDTITFTVVPPLVAGEAVSVEQAFPSCDYKSAKSADAHVLPTASVLSLPIIEGPLCPGATSVLMTQLFPGAVIEILVNGSSLGTAQIPNVTQFAFPVPPLPAGAEVTARMRLCDAWGKDGVAEVSGVAGTAHPAIPTPVHECGNVVRVNGVVPGATVAVWSQQLNAPVGQALAFDTHVDVPVSPLLIGGDHIHAVVTGCGNSQVASAAVLVQAGVKKPDPPTVKPPVSFTSLVTVEHVLAGAMVDVFVNGAFRGSKAFAVPTDTVTITGTLQVNDKVKARQRLCAWTSSFSPIVAALAPPPPVAGFAPMPTSGQFPLSVHFTNQSTGVSTGYHWTFGDGATSQDVNPDHLFANPGTYTVTLIATGPGGNSAPVSHQVTAYHAPPTATVTAQPTSGSAPLAVHFSASTSPDVTSREWQFGDGGTSADPNPTHTYQAGGTFHPTLTVRNDNPSPYTAQGPAITVAPGVQPSILVSYTPPTHDPMGNVIAGKFRVTGSGFTNSGSVTIQNSLSGAVASTIANTPAPGHIDVTVDDTYGWCPSNGFKWQAIDQSTGLGSNQYTTSC